ncbi:MAG: ABC transporter substrate-binding protein [Granulosicoccus sp.]
MTTLHTFKISSLAIALLGSSLGSAHACEAGKGTVNILSNDFPALQTIGARAEECASDTVQITKNQTSEHRTIQVPALTTNPASYSVAVISNSSLVPLLNDDLVQPLDELVEKYGQALQPSQLIRIDGKVMAIAFMANAQHFWYRKDLFDKAGLSAPASYEDVLASAEALRTQGIMENPIAANLKAGWDLGAEFVNMYTGMGGDLFADGSAEANINNEQGIKTLEMLKSLSGYMSPDFVTYNSNEVSPLWEAGEVAMYNGWGSRVAGIIDPEGKALPEVRENSVFISAPMVGGGTVPATRLWWDGFALAKNISPEDAESSFQVMMHALSPDLLAEHSAEAVWLLDGYEPTPASAGVIATVQAKALPFPMQPYMGLLHTALGENLSEYLQGQESAEQALADATNAYVTAATEGGFLK